jgi:addiction module RelB/DinJ family antitoxin
MAVVNIQIDDVVKNKAEELFSTLGFDISSAVNLLLKQAILKRSVAESEINNKLSSENQAKLGGWEGKVWMSDDFDEPL